MGYFSRALDNLPKACADIGVTVKRLHEDVETVKQWLRQQPHLPNADNGLLVENMLLRNKGNVELAKQTLECFFTNRGTYPELYGTYDPCSADDVQSHELRTILLMPGLTSTGHRVVVGNFPPPGTKLDQRYVKVTLKQGMMHSDLISDEDIACGLIYVFDARNVNIFHTTMVLRDFSLVQKTARCFFTGYKFRVKAIHIFRPPPTINSILKVTKPILPKKISGRMHFHPDLASLHRHVERQVLPKDFGGDQKSLTELAADWRKEEISYRQWFADREKSWKTDESKRPPGSRDNAFGFKGSFKKLEVD